MRDKNSPITYVQIEELQVFIERAHAEFGSPEKAAEADVVADILIQMLEKRGMISEHANQSFIDVLITAAYLHNLFYNEYEWTTLFKAREILMPIAKDMGIAENVTDVIFQTIEAQLGNETPVPSSRPAPNSPVELFANAIWIAKEYKPRV